LLDSASGIREAFAAGAADPMPDGRRQAEGRMAADPLSDLLKTVRLTGAAYFEIVAQEPWAVASPPRELILPKILPGADHLIAYHVVTAGRCFATAAGGQPIPLEAGEVIVFTNAQSHVMSSRPNMHADPPMPDVLEVAAAAQKPFCINLSEGTISANLVCGYLACDSGPFNPLLENLPPVIKSGDHRSDGPGWIGQFIRLAVTEAAEKHAGSETVLMKLSELMFIDVVRRYLEALPPGQAGWLAGLRDPFVGKALSLMHARPAANWTIEELAKQAGLSRSVLAERFTELVGIPPMHYLAKWRMQIASELLIGGKANLASIAAEIGYESEAAFSRAFKKMVGVPPSTWRRRGP
jgi:AraC-like DNA-binding protein